MMFDRLSSRRRFFGLSSLGALATGLAAGAAQAQVPPSYNAGPGTIVSGTVNQVRGSGTDTFNVNSATAVIDFTPSDTAISNGVPINFQGAGTTATYTSTLADFTVLNRIVPTDTSRPVTFNGHVVSQLTNPASGLTTRGGTVWFYSPGGIVLSGTSVFDVGNLLLTTGDPTGGTGTIGSQSNFSVTTATGNGIINIQAGAAINAPRANSYIALVAPIIQQAGTVTVNGSAAYVAAEAATLNFSGGLFSITVTTGSDGGTTSTNFPLRHTGVTQGPSNVVNSDNHGIYLVTMPKNVAVTMIVAPSGQLGFDVAGSASVQNGQVILAAGRNVASGVIDDSFHPSAQAANIAISGGGDFTSAVTAHATDQAGVSAASGQNLRFDQGLDLLGGTAALISVTNGGAVNVGGGNALIRSFADNGAGGSATIDTFGSGQITVANDLSVRADRGPNTPTPTGGTASITSNGGPINAGTLTVSSMALGDGGQTLTGGQASIIVNVGGGVNVAGATNVDARVLRTGPASSGAGGNSTGGSASAVVSNGTLASTGALNVLANVEGGSADTGGTAGGATARILIDPNRGTITAGDTTVDASAVGGAGGDGAGGNATGGSASVTIVAPGGSGTAPKIQVSSLYTSGAATGGAGTNGAGGSATGGTSLVSTAAGGSLIATNNVTGTTEAIGGTSDANAAAGNATGGATTFTASGTANAAAIFLIGRATGGNKTGGTGNAGSASAGSTVLSGTAGGKLSASGTVNIDSSALGGSVLAGTGTGGSGQAAGAYVVADGNGTQVTLAGLVSAANGTAGASRAVATASDGHGNQAYASQGNGGRLDVIGSVTMTSNGTGGAITAGIGTGTAGSGTGGDVRFVSNDGTITAGTDVTLTARGIGGSSSGGAAGGDGTGGGTDIGADAVLTSVGRDATLDSSGIGGDALSGVGSGGAGSAGSVFIGPISIGQVTIGRNVLMTGDGRGGAAIGAGASGGAGAGGNVQIFATSGSVAVTGNSVITANGYGGAKTDGTAGTIGTSSGNFANVGAFGGSLTFTGNLSISSAAFGADTGTAASEAAVTGGTATISTDANLGGTINVVGSTFINAGATRTTTNLAGSNAATTGGTASIFSGLGAITLGNNVTVGSDASALDSGISASPASVVGGTSAVRAVGGSITLGNNVLVSASGNAGTIAPLGRGIGLPARGGTIDFSASAGQTLTAGDVTLSAFGIGGSGFSTSIAGTGTGGTITAVATGDITTGSLSLDAQGFGGDKILGATGGGGIGAGGHATMRAQGGTFTVNGNVSIDASATGGGNSFLVGGGVSNGGLAIGGGARLDTVGTNSLIQISGNVAIKVNATGTDGVGAGSVGGNGVAGNAPSSGPFNEGAYLVASTGDISIGGNDIQLNANAAGGSGAAGGGRANGGLTNILAQNGTITLTDPTAIVSMNALGVGGAAISNGTTFGGATGGDGIGGFAVLASATDANGPSTITIPNLTAVATGIGGSGAPGLSGATGTDGGAGGAGSGGQIVAIAEAGNGHLITNVLQATANGQGGAGGAGGASTGPVAGANGGRGGAGTGGLATLGLFSGVDSTDNNGFVNFDTVTTTLNGTGGAGANGGAGGTQSMPGPNNTTIFFTVQGNGADGGDGTGGSTKLYASGGQVTIGDVTMNAVGQGGSGGTGNSDGIGARGNGGLNLVSVTNRTNRTERGSLNIFSLTSDTSGKFGNSPSGTFGSSGGGTQISVTSGDATIDNINYTNDGFDVPTPGNETTFTVDDGTLTSQQVFANAVGDVTVGTTATGRFETNTFDVFTGGSLLFANPSDSAALGNFVVNNDFFVSIGGDYSAQALLTFGGNATIYAANIQTSDITANGGVSLNGYFTVTTGNIVSGDTIDLNTNIGGGSSDIITGNLTASDNVQVKSLGGSVVIGNVSATNNISLDATNVIQAGTLSGGSGGSISVTAESGPITVGDTMGGSVTIVADDDVGTSGDVRTGNIVAANGNVRVISNGGATIVGTVNAGDGITLGSTSGVTSGALTAGTLGGSVSALIDISASDGPVDIGNVSGGAITIFADGTGGEGGNVTTGNLLTSIGDVQVSATSLGVFGNVTSAGGISLSADGGLTAGALGAPGLIDLLSDDGPVVIGNASGGTIRIASNGSGTSGNVTTGNLATTIGNVDVRANGAAAIGNVTSASDILLTANRALTTAALGTGSSGAINVSATNGPITVAGATGGAITIITDNGSGTAGNIVTGDLTATASNVSLFASGGAVFAGNLRAADGISITATGPLAAGTLTAGTKGSGVAGLIGISSAVAPIAVGNVSGGAFTVSGGTNSDVATGTITVRNVEIHSLGKLTTGNLSVLASVGTSLPVQPVIALSATGDLTTGSITADRLIALASAGGSVRTGALSTSGSVAAFAAQNISFSGATTGTGAQDSLFLSNIATLNSNPDFAALKAMRANSTFDPATLARSTPTAVAGTIQSTGAISAGNLIAAANGALQFAAINATTRVALATGGSVTAGAVNTPASLDLITGGDISLGTIDAADLLLVSTGGSVTTGTIRSGRNAIALASGSIVLGGMTTGLVTANGPGAVYLGNASQRSLISGSDRSALLAAAPVATGGAIQINGAITTGAVSVASGAALTLSNAITASGNVALSAIGAATIGGAISAGTVNVTSGAALTLSNAITASGNVGLSATGAATVGGVITASAVNISSGAALTLPSAITASGNVALNATGAATIGGAISAGTVNVTSGAALTLSNAVTASGNITLSATGLATIGGAIAAPSISLASSDIALTGSLSASSANTLRLIARGGSAGVRFGGDGSGGGYNLSATEAALLRSPNIIFDADGDVLVGAATLNGGAVATSANLVGTTGKLTINSPGTIRVTGALQLNNMASGNRLTLNAVRRVEVATDLGGSITLLSGTAADALGGTLELIGNTIAVGNSALLTQLASNPRFSGRDAALAAAAATPRPAGYLQANRIELAGVDTIAIQNSGTADAYAGFTAGSGGMEVRTALGSATTVTTPVDLAIFGRVQAASGFLTGAQTRTGITFTPVAQTAGFSADATVNGCLIATVDCTRVPAIPPEIVAVAPNLVDMPFLNASAVGGAPMPELRIAPAIDQSALTIETVIDEPISSGGNPSFWGGATDSGGSSGGEAVTGTGTPNTGNGNGAQGGGSPTTGAGNGATGNGDGAQRGGNPTTGAGNGAQGGSNAATGTGAGNQGSGGQGANGDPNAGTGNGVQGGDNPAPGGDNPATGTRNGATGSGNPGTGTGSGNTGQRRPGVGE